MTRPCMPRAMDRRALAIACVLIAAPLALPVPAAASGTDLAITEIVPDPASGEREFIELHNPGNASVPLLGWKVRDAANNTFTFGNETLAAGGRIVVWGGGGDDALGPAWSMASAWNNGGDTAYLLRPDGTTADTLTYGPGGHDIPAKGKALALVDGVWQEMEPTPGASPDAGGGTATADVLDVPPEAAITDAPLHVRTGTAFSVTIDVSEPNGDAVSWTLSGGGDVLETGDTTGSTDIAVTAPLVAQSWTLALEATDPEGNTATHTRVVDVRAGDLVVEVPAGGIGFPAFAPGATDIAGNTTFTLESLANASFQPRFDLSPFRADGNEIPVDGHVSIGLRPAGTNTTWSWTAYTGPLTPLPSIAPGEQVDVLLRLDDVPETLPAGTYGTSFTVVR